MIGPRVLYCRRGLYLIGWFLTASTSVDNMVPLLTDDDDNDGLAFLVKLDLELSFPVKTSLASAFFLADSFATVLFDLLFDFCYCSFFYLLAYSGLIS